MILQASLIGGWDKLELWGHTHLALFALLILVCVAEVILLKITTSVRLFTRPQHYDSDYDDSGEYEEDIYYEEISGFNAQRSGGQEHQQDTPFMQQQQTQYFQNNYNQTRDEDNSYNINHYHSTSADVFRFVY